MADSDKIPKREKNVVLAKILFILTFFLPYLMVTMDNEFTQSFAFYSPTWMLGVQNGVFLGGFTPVMLALFYFWIPYPIIGYISLNYSEGKYSDISTFLIRLFGVTLIASLIAIPLTILNSSSGRVFFPFPVTTILALLMIPFMKPQKPLYQQTPWEEQPSTEPAVFEK